MLLCDHEIRKYAQNPVYNAGRPMIEPFAEFWPYGVERLPPGVISYGLSHAGYDIRLAEDVLVFNDAAGEVVDPKRFKDADYRERVFRKARVYSEPCLHPPADPGSQHYVIIPPQGYILGHSLERFQMPHAIQGDCLGKSTYARCGIIVNVTPLEPSWDGHLTIEISNDTPLPARVYVHEGIAQIRFHRTNARPEVTYADKQGKYQDQKGVQPAKVL